MKINKLSARQVKEANLIKEKRTKRRIITWFVLITFFVLISVQLYTYWDQIKFKYRKNALYGKVVPADLICMNGNYFMMHKTKKFVFKDKVYYMCSEYCEMAVIDDYNKVGFTKDTISGNRINKADAIPGLRQKNKPEIIYFAGMKNFQTYYKNEKKK
jgi:hypothetical protein